MRTNKSKSSLQTYLNETEVRDEIMNHDPKNLIILVGEHKKLLYYDTVRAKWHTSKFSVQSSYQGWLKYTSICKVEQNNIFVMTGGCSIQNLEPVRNTYIFSLNNLNNFKSFSPLNICRYGHSSISMNGLIYVMGGFDHRDDEMNSPNTLSSCEIISFNDDQSL